VIPGIPSTPGLPGYPAGPKSPKSPFSPSSPLSPVRPYCKCSRYFFKLFIIQYLLDILFSQTRYRNLV
jgi:hypothetical protein